MVGEEHEKEGEPILFIGRGGRCFVRSEDEEEALLCNEDAVISREDDGKGEEHKPVAAVAGSAADVASARGMDVRDSDAGEDDDRGVRGVGRFIERGGGREEAMGTDDDGDDNDDDIGVGDSGDDDDDVDDGNPSEDFW